MLFRRAVRLQACGCIRATVSTSVSTNNKQQRWTRRCEASKVREICNIRRDNKRVGDSYRARANIAETIEAIVLLPCRVYPEGVEVYFFV